MNEKRKSKEGLKKIEIVIQHVTVKLPLHWYLRQMGMKQMRYNVVRKMKKLDKLQHKMLNSTMGDYWIPWEH